MACNMRTQLDRYPANPDIEAVFWAGDDRPEGTVAVLAVLGAILHQSDRPTQN